jgi:hypothetical protein
VTWLYPVERQKEFRPIANAIIYSFEFYRATLIGVALSWYNGCLDRQAPGVRE